jgi:hypothetical protein
MTDQQLATIFALRGSMSQSAIAREVGVSFQHVSRIVQGKSGRVYFPSNIGEAAAEEME